MTVYKRDESFGFMILNKKLTKNNISNNLVFEDYNITIDIFNKVGNKVVIIIIVDSNSNDSNIKKILLSFKDTIYNHNIDIPFQRDKIKNFIQKNIVTLEDGFMSQKYLVDFLKYLK